jgi:polysaccharide transporter, PST family
LNTGRNPCKLPPWIGHTEGTGDYRVDRSSKHRLIGNTFSLTVLQCANYVLPLVTLPYLMRTLDADKYGLVIFAQSFMQYFIILTDYGFAFSATRDIATRRSNPAEVATIFSAVLLAKLVLVALSFLIMLGLVTTVPKFQVDPKFYLLTFGFVVGQAIFPAWFFQGIERMEFVAMLNLLARLLFTVLIFVVVRSNEDYLLVPLMNAVGSITAGVLGLVIAVTKFRIRPVLPSFRAFTQQVRASHEIFVAKAATTLYTASNVVILGFFADNEIVGYYGTGEKIVRAVQGLTLPFSQAVYPYVSRLAHESPERALRFIRKVTWPLIAVTCAMSLALLFGAGLIERLMSGRTPGTMARVIQIQSFLPLIVGLHIPFANCFLLGFGFARIWSRIIVGSGVLGLIVALVLVGVFKTGYIGLSINVVLTECLILVLSLLAFRRRRPRASDVLQPSAEDQCCA